MDNQSEIELEVPYCMKIGMHIHACYISLPSDIDQTKMLAQVYAEKRDELCCFQQRLVEPDHGLTLWRERHRIDGIVCPECQHQVDKNEMYFDTLWRIEDTEMELDDGN